MDLMINLFRDADDDDSKWDHVLNVMLLETLHHRFWQALFFWSMRTEFLSRSGNTCSCFIQLQTIVSNFANEPLHCSARERCRALLLFQYHWMKTFEFSIINAMRFMMTLGTSIFCENGRLVSSFSKFCAWARCSSWSQSRRWLTFPLWLKNCPESVIASFVM